MDRSLYEEHASLERDHWWFVGRRAILEASLTAWLPPVEGRRILDVGCGTGGMLPMLARFGAVSGIEGEPVAVEHCHTAFGEFDVRQGEIPADVPSDGSFDVVTAFDVIEHVDDDQGALRSLHAAVRPGGIAVITVPALAWLWSDHDVVNGHRRRYAREGLITVMELAGFGVVHCSYFNTLLLPTVAGARVAQRFRRQTVVPHSDFSMPGPRLNQLLARILSSERSAVTGRGLPVGVSLVAVAERAR